MNNNYEKEKEKQSQWDMAIGLNQVDSLIPSKDLLKMSLSNIKGTIKIKKIEDILKQKLKNNDKNNLYSLNEYECDLVSTRIVKLLNTNNFSFTIDYFREIHEYLFKDIYSFAGKYRECNLTKEEPILNGDTVLYCDYNNIQKTLSYDFSEEENYVYSNKTIEEKILHIASFTSKIWQVHPFREGNTRTVALFIVKYLKSQGYDINNDLFSKRSLYFRNSLVRSNFRDKSNNVEITNIYLVEFFENLIIDKNNVLSNKDLLVSKSKLYKNLKVYNYNVINNRNII